MQVLLIVTAVQAGTLKYGVQDTYIALTVFTALTCVLMLMVGRSGHVGLALLTAVAFVARFIVVLVATVRAGCGGLMAMRWDWRWADDCVMMTLWTPAVMG